MNIEVTSGTPKIYLAGYAKILPFSFKWGFKEISHKDDVYQYCNNLRTVDLPLKDKIKNIESKYSDATDILACESVLSTNIIFSIPKYSSKWILKRKQRIMKAI